MSGVDVLAVLDEALNDCQWLLRNSTKTMEVTPSALTEARAAVAELLKCSDVTVKAFEALGRSNGVVEQLESHRNCERALIEQKAALARVQGGVA